MLLNIVDCILPEDCESLEVDVKIKTNVLGGTGRLAVRMPGGLITPLDQA